MIEYEGSLHQYRHCMAEWKAVNGTHISCSLDMEPDFCIHVHLGGKKQAMKKKTYLVSRHSIKLKTSPKESEQSEKKAWL